MAADLDFKIDGDSSGLQGAIKSATKTMQDFGLLGGPPILAAKAAVAGVEKAFGGMKQAADLGARAMRGFVDSGKGAVALLNQINGAVELANKVIPALTFPLAMADNAEKAKEAFGGLQTAWQEVAGALGEGVNDALIPILRSAGFEMGKLKEKAREIGQGIGEAIDITRVSYQMGSLGDIVWVGLQKTTLQWGASLLEMFTTLAFKIGRLLDDTIMGTIAFALDAIGADGKAASMRANSDARQANSKDLEAEALAGMKNFLSPVYDKIGELGDEMARLQAPVKERISQEKMLTQAGEGLAKGFGFLKAQVDNFFGTGSTGAGGAAGKPDGLLPQPRLWKTSNNDPMAWQGPMQGDKQVWQKQQEKNKANATKEGGESPMIVRPNRQAITLARQYQRQAGTGSGAQGWQEFLNSGVRTSGLSGAQIATMRKLDPAQLARTVTNKTGASAAAKQEQAAQQKDAKAAAAMEAVVKGIPQIAQDMTAVKNHLSKIQSR